MRILTLRFTVCCLAVLALFALTGCNSDPAPAGGGVGVINAERVFEESEAGKAGVAYLNSISEEMQKGLGELQKASQTNENKEEAEAALQQGFIALQQRFNAEQQQVMTKLNELFIESVESCRKDKKLSVIIDMSSAVSHDVKADVTADVIKDMNAKEISFAQLAPENGTSLPSSNATVPASNATSAQ